MLSADRGIKLLFVSALLAFSCAPAFAADKIQAALLWIPGPESDLQAELQALSNCDSCRLTIAFGGIF